jgi:hypothetical protein
MILPYRSVLINVDGETQTEARFILRDRLPESGNWSLNAQIYHGISEQHAGQILHDFNRYAFPVKENIVAALNSEGAVTRMIDSCLKEKGFDSWVLNRYGNRPKKDQVCSYRSLFAAVVGASSGLKGIHNQGREIGLLNNGDNGLAAESGRRFLGHVLDLINQDRSIGADVPILFALFGAISHDFGKFLTAEQWRECAQTYKKFNAQGVGRGKSFQKQNAVLDFLGLAEKGV